MARTGRLLCVGEAWPWGGVTAEVIARVATEGFGLLDAPPQRLNAKDTPIPYHPNLWAAHRPTARSIAAAARNLLARPDANSLNLSMPSIPIIMPQLGESIAEATVIRLLVQAGDPVQTDQDIIEVETNKATMNVASPCPGRVEKSGQTSESYPVGAVLGYLEASREDAAAWDWTPRRRDWGPTTGGEPGRRPPGPGRQPGKALSRRCGVCPCRPMPPARVTCRRG